MTLLSFEEFAWRCLWTECGRLSEYVASQYTLQKVREIKRRARKNELWQKPYFEKSEYASMVRSWYAHYLKTGDL